MCAWHVAASTAYGPRSSLRASTVGGRHGQGLPVRPTVPLALARGAADVTNQFAASGRSHTEPFGAVRGGAGSHPFPRPAESARQARGIRQS